MMRTFLSISILSVGLFALPVSAPTEAQDHAQASAVAASPNVARFQADLDAFVTRAMARVEAVPGLAVAVVNGDQTTYVAGYGLADVERRIRVTPQTRFYIASATKSFTALAIASMARRGEVLLDAPLATWSLASGVPSDIASRVTLADLLSHRSGITNGPIAYRVAFSGDWTNDRLWELTSETAPASVPQGTFAYTNAGYNLSTVLLERRFGKDWRRLVKDEVLTPIGMVNTTSDIDTMRSRGRPVAWAYLGSTANGPVRSPLQKTNQTMQSAGGLISTADDMALWLQAQINDGVVNGHRVLPEGLIASTHAQRVVQQNIFGPYVRTGYGLGWQIGRYGNDPLLHHFGNFAGSRAHVSFMPARRLGVAVMVNEDAIAGNLADLVANYVYDWFARLPNLESNYDAKLAELVSARDARRAALVSGEQSRAARPRMLSMPNSAYVGDYDNAVWGRVRIRDIGKTLEVRIGVQRAIAQNFTRPDSVRVELVPFSGEAIDFQMDEQQRPASLTYGGQTFRRNRR